jgi:DNA topoisomerase-3
VPSAELAAVIGSDPVARPQVVKKLWDYIKANGLQDAKDKRSINADAKLLPCLASLRSPCLSWRALSASI